MSVCAVVVVVGALRLCERVGGGGGGAYMAVIACADFAAAVRVGRLVVFESRLPFMPAACLGLSWSVV